MVDSSAPVPRLGLCLSEFPLDGDGRWRNVADVVARVEASGAEGLWLADHILWHSKAIDAQSTLPVLASHAQRITIGSCVLQLPLRDPVTVAKTFANTQMMAPGRVVCGVGIGENAEEYERLGRSMRTRGKVIEASIDEIRRVWGERGGTRWMNPEPVDIPIWVGGRAEAARRRAARLGDGWLPYLCSPRWFARHRALLEEEAAEAGRDPAAITKAVVTFVDLPSVVSEQQDAAKLEHWFGFDPTPRSIAYVKQQALPVGFELREYGVGDHDGVVTFHAPENPEHISHSMVARKGAATHEFPIKRLSTIMREHGHRRLDVLKLDVEGAEYDVLDQLIAQKLDIDQLLIEFHHQLPGIPPARTARALQALRDGGWGVVHVAANLREFSLARR